jgi:hypothetical protein
MLTAALSTLLHAMLRLVPPERRDWVEAVLGEAAEAPAGRARLSWLVGGVWLVLWESGLLRRIAYTTAGLGAGVALLWLDRHPGSANPAAAIGRVMNGLEFLVPAVVPWVARPLFGPVADARAARALRVGGYLALYALMLVMVGVSRYAGSRFDSDSSGMTPAEVTNWTASVRTGAALGGLLVTGILGGYAFLLLACTSRRWAVPSTTLLAGGGGGVLTALFVYALTPVGSPLPMTNRALTSLVVAGIFLVPPAVFVAIGRYAARRAGSAVESAHPGPPDEVEAAALAAGFRQGRLAGLLAGGVCTLLLGVVTVSTMLLFPHSVSLVWANPDQDAPHGTPYEWQMSLGDSAAKYEAGLVIGPLVGLFLGALGSAGVGPSPAPRDRPRPNNALITP